MPCHGLEMPFLTYGLHCPAQGSLFLGLKSRTPCVSPPSAHSPPLSLRCLLVRCILGRTVVARRPSSAWSGAGVGEARQRGPRVWRREVPGAPSPRSWASPSAPFPSPAGSYPGARHTLRPRGLSSWGAAGPGNSQSSSSSGGGGSNRGGGPPAPRRRAGPAPRGPAPSMRRGAGAGRARVRPQARAAGSGVRGRAGGGRRGAGPGRKFHIGSLIPGQPRPARRQRPPRAPDPTLWPRRRPSARPPPPRGRAQTWGQTWKGPARGIPDRRSCPSPPQTPTPEAAPARSLRGQARDGKEVGTRRDAPKLPRRPRQQRLRTARSRLQAGLCPPAPPRGLPSTRLCHQCNQSLQATAGRMLEAYG